MRSQQSQSSLNEEQRAVNSAVSDNCCVIAIPGSGKTHTVINKIVTILKGHEQRLWTSPHTVQAVTFTKSAAVELQQRAAKQLSSESQTRLRTGTFHSLFGNALKRSNSLLMTRKLAIDAVADGYLRRAIEECLSQYFSSRKPQDTEDIKTLILAARSKVEIPGGIQSLLVGSFFGIPAEAVNACLQSYRKNMARAKLRDHEMTLEEALLFLRSKGEIERTDQFLRRQNEFLKDTGFEMAWVDEWRNFIDFDHLFVDEAQDIDSVQLQIILEIANTGVVVDIVGDDDQSIYAFRHALGYSGMKEFVSKTGAREMLLQTNYRCKTEILRMADAIIQQNDPTNRKPKTLSGSRGGGGIVTLDMFKTQDFELHWTACAIGDLIKGTAQTSPKIAVLARVGSVLDLVERNLTTSGIKYTRIDDKSIWSEEPICFFLHLLARIADDNVESEVVWLESLGWIENPAERDAVAAQLRAVTTVVSV
jgi:superfamily I DNA/RNA helicase